MFTDCTDKLPRYSNMMLEKCDDVLDDLRQATAELMVDIVTTRRLRMLNNPEQHIKSKFVKLVTSKLSDEQWLYTGNLQLDNIYCFNIHIVTVDLTWTLIRNHCVSFYVNFV